MAVFDRLFRRTPAEYTLEINAGQQRIQVGADENLLQAALRQGLAFPHNCRIGGCGACKCKLVSGKVKEQTDKSYLLTAEELKENVILACQSLPRSDLAIEVQLQAARAAFPVVETTGLIAAVEPVTHDIVRVTVKLDHPMGYAAGQYAELVVPEQVGNAAGQARCYSFASPCTASAGADPAAGCDTVDFFVRRVPGGAFTGWLFDADRVGVPLRVRGPYGDFHLRPGSQPLLCIAGGSGLGPIKAMLEQAVLDRETTRDLFIILGARTQADLYGLDALDAIRRAWTARFEFVPVLSAEDASGNWAGRRGLIHEQLAQIVGDGLGEHQAYLCGPPQMIDACIATLQAAGTPVSQIFFDKFLDRSTQAALAA